MINKWMDDKISNSVYVLKLSHFKILKIKVFMSHPIAHLI